MLPPESSPIDTQPIQPPRQAPPGATKKKDNTPLTAYLIGLLSGILLMLVIGLLAFGLGIFPFGGSGVCPAPGACPPTVGLLPLCPTCEAVATRTPTSTVTPTATRETATPNIGATATAACGIFLEQFPGTPCPP